MNKQHIICSVSLLGAIVVSCNEKPKLPKQPDIIYILADDLGYGELVSNQIRKSKIMWLPKTRTLFKQCVKK